MNLVSILLLAFVIVTWGYSWVLMKQALEYMQPITFVALRIALGGLVILPFILRNKDFRPASFLNRNYIVLGLLQTTAMFWPNYLRHEICHGGENSRSSIYNACMDKFYAPLFIKRTS